MITLNEEEDQAAIGAADSDRCPSAPSRAFWFIFGAGVAVFFTPISDIVRGLFGLAPAGLARARARIERGPKT